MNILEDLFYGELHPNESIFKNNEATALTIDAIEQASQFLKSALEGETCKKLFDLINAYDELVAIGAQEGFICGFRIGTRFAIDTFGVDESCIREAWYRIKNPEGLGVPNLPGFDCIV